MASREDRQGLTPPSSDQVAARPNVGSATCRGLRDDVRGDRGATAAEYALMATLIAVAIVGVVAIFGQEVAQLFGIPPGYF